MFFCFTNFSDLISSVPIVKDQSRVGGSVNLPSGNTAVSTANMITGENTLSQFEFILTRVKNFTSPTKKSWFESQRTRLTRPIFFSINIFFSRTYKAVQYLMFCSNIENNYIKKSNNRKTPRAFQEHRFSFGI